MVKERWFTVDGSSYEGLWFEGKQNGKGVSIDHSGRRMEGSWQNGVLVTSI
jgi:hypothetical protein